MREQLAGDDVQDAVPTWRRLWELGLLDLVAGRDDGGLGRGQQELAIVHEEMGRRVCDDRFVRGALVTFDLWDQAPVGDRTRALMRETCTSIDARALLGIGEDGLEAKEEGVDDDAPDRPDRRLDACSVDGEIRTVRLVDPRHPDATGTIEADVHPSAIRRAVDRDRVRAAAYLVGLGQRSLDLARARASERLIAGRPLIERQAAAHRIARSALVLERARVEVWEAAWLDDVRDGAAYQSITAFAVAAEAAMFASRQSMQLHGAAGSSDGEVARAYLAAHLRSAAYGSIDELWREAARQRSAGS